MIGVSLQFAANELRLSRIRLLSGAITPEQRTYDSVDSPELGTSHTARDSVDMPNLSTSLEDQRLKVPASKRKALNPSDPGKPRSFSEGILDAMSYVVPIKKLNPDEYASLLEKKRREDEQEAKERAGADDQSKDSRAETSVHFR